MKPNMGWFERILRVTVGGLLISSAAIDQPFMTDGWMVWVSGIFGLLLVVTGLIGYCWLYGYLDNMVEEPARPARKKRPSAKRTSRSKSVAKKSSRKSAKSKKRRTSRKK